MASINRSIESDTSWKVSAHIYGFCYDFVFWFNQYTVKQRIELTIIINMPCCTISTHYYTIAFARGTHNLDVDKLLGEPIQKDLETNSGIKATMESILGICTGTKISFNLRLVGCVVSMFVVGTKWIYVRQFTSDHLIKMLNHGSVRSTSIGRQCRRCRCPLRWRQWWQQQRKQ